MSSISPAGSRISRKRLPGLLLLLLGSVLPLQAVADKAVPASEIKVIQKLIFERKMAEAAPRLDAAIENYPDSGRLAFLLGQLYYFSNIPNYPKAVAAYDKAESALSKDSELYFFRAVAKAQVLSAYSQRLRPDYAGALADYRKAEALGSERDLRLDIARTLYETWDYPAALEQINRYLNNKPQLWADGRCSKAISWHKWASMRQRSRVINEPRDSMTIWISCSFIRPSACGRWGDPMRLWRSSIRD